MGVFFVEQRTKMHFSRSIAHRHSHTSMASARLVPATFPPSTFLFLSLRASHISLSLSSSLFSLHLVHTHPFRRIYHTTSPPTRLLARPLAQLPRAARDQGRARRGAGAAAPPQTGRLCVARNQAVLAQGKGRHRSPAPRAGRDRAAGGAGSAAGAAGRADGEVLGAARAGTRRTRR